MIWGLPRFEASKRCRLQGASCNGYSGKGGQRADRRLKVEVERADRRLGVEVERADRRLGVEGDNRIVFGLSYL
uniref:Uncharacterized protein n=1 Tax=Candidatus Kentrum sp. LPFa TaxID=2126335 RepID=A0A450Y2H0_9GAMM|nr:MAG: hypothetical protein BECKLPF1236A_GA0070988_103573 [Candidatus Kentron sp. LPFa]VFK35652.1 MAG: hypothetical protein BECKLPF1236C_GA0070990_104032 [Candidatus Kentron sp. LPFa]